MEKEKLKQMEKQKEKEEKDTLVDPHKPSSQDTMEILKSTMKERQRSRFVSFSLTCIFYIPMYIIKRKLNQNTLDSMSHP